MKVSNNMIDWLYSILLISEDDHYPLILNNKYEEDNALTAENNFMKSLNLLNTPRINVTPSGDCIPT